MIKAFGRAGTKPLLIIGLTTENMTRLAAGQPITFDTAELGHQPPVQVLVVGGSSEDAIQAELDEHLGAAQSYVHQCDGRCADQPT